MIFIVVVLLKMITATALSEYEKWEMFGQSCLQDKSVKPKSIALKMAGKLKQLKFSSIVCISKFFCQTQVY